jgi:UDP-4-amino-4,6-dideoxy-N-acetyl-beta-L-altrosamine transaminase
LAQYAIAITPYELKQDKKAKRNFAVKRWVGKSCPFYRLTSQSSWKNMNRIIPYGRQDISEADVQAVINVLRSDFLTQGPTVPAFEKATADYCGCYHAVATNSATSALHIACLALGVGKSDSVWTSPTTFVASSNCALYCGATVDFVDIDPHTYNLSIEKLTEKLEQAAKIGKLPKVVIPVHLSGQSCEMQAIYELSQHYGFKIIEDASHAIGGKYQGETIGNCKYSDITIFSFHPVKIITTAEGGMALTNNPQLAKRIRLLRSHGITSDVPDMLARPAEEIWNYQQIDLGFNYRMTDIQAALGLSQMQRLDEFVAKRHAIAQRYNELLAELPLLLPWQHPDSYSSFHLYPIRLKLNQIKKSHQQVYQALREKGVLVNLHYIPVYLQPYYENMGFKRGHCPEAEKYYTEVLSIPMYSSLTNEQQEYVLKTLSEILNG